MDGEHHGDDDNQNDDEFDESDEGPEIVVTPPPPNECAANSVTIIIEGLFQDPPNNADYYVPEDWGEEDFFNAVNYLSQFAPEPGGALTNHTDPWVSTEFIDRVKAFAQLYFDPTDPNFLDFKKWGTSSGPSESVSGGQVTYFSPAEGKAVTANTFEAFGNFMFGYMAAVAGFNNFETRMIAAVTQNTEATTIGELLVEIALKFAALDIPEDDPRDDPHVKLGFEARLSYSTDYATVIQINTTECPKEGGSSGGPSAGSSAPPIDTRFGLLPNVHLN